MLHGVSSADKRKPRRAPMGMTRWRRWGVSVTLKLLEPAKDARYLAAKSATWPGTMLGSSVTVRQVMGEMEKGPGFLEIDLDFPQLPDESMGPRSMLHALRRACPGLLFPPVLQHLCPGGS